MPGAGVILRYVGAVSQNSAWVPPETRPAAAGSVGRAVAAALRLVGQSARAWQHDQDLALRLTDDAVGLIGPDAVLAVLSLQGTGQLPACDTPEWQQLVTLADAGKVTIGTVLLIGEHDYVCEDRIADRLALSGPPARPLSSRDELRDMGML
jgi:hypothetical protein